MSSVDQIGSLPYFNVAVDETPVLVMAGAVRIFGRNISAPGAAAWVWINLYDKLTAAEVTPGTTVPKQSWPIPVNGILDTFPANPLAFSKGLVIAVTSLPSGSAAPSADCVVNFSLQNDGVFL